MVKNEPFQNSKVADIVYWMAKENNLIAGKIGTVLVLANNKKKMIENMVWVDFSIDVREEKVNQISFLTSEEKIPETIDVSLKVLFL